MGTRFLLGVKPLSGIRRQKSPKNVNEKVKRTRNNVVQFEQPQPQKKKAVNIIPRNIAQEDYLSLLMDRKKHIVVATGPAGTGKTLLAMTAAVKALKEGLIEKIILTRPAVAVEDEKFGFLPGDLNSKMAPWVVPMFDVLHEYYSPRDTIGMLEEGIIEIAPLAFIRGRTFKNAWVIADEMQNATISQLLSLLTRIGDGCRIIVTGDIRQADRRLSDNGLHDLVKKLKNNINSFGLIEFNIRDVQRHPMVQEVLELYGEI